MEAATMADNAFILPRSYFSQSMASSTRQEVHPDLLLCADEPSPENPIP
jgi:hypothetical protein